MILWGKDGCYVDKLRPGAAKEQYQLPNVVLKTAL